MNLWFRDQFVPFVEDGSKTHTIRAGSRWKAGMRADLYARPRQPKKFALERTEGDVDCICMEPGTLLKNSKRVYGRPLCSAERHNRYKQVQVAGMRLLFRAPVKVETIDIREVLIGLILKDGSMTKGLPRKVIEIEGVRLSPDECDLLAWRDGFRHLLNGHPSEALGHGGCFAMMMEFWRGRLPFHGQIIHWDYAQRFMEKPVKHHTIQGIRGPVGGGGDWSQSREASVL